MNTTLTAKIQGTIAVILMANQSCGRAAFAVEWNFYVVFLSSSDSVPFCLLRFSMQITFRLLPGFVKHKLVYTTLSTRRAVFAEQLFFQTIRFFSRETQDKQEKLKIFPSSGNWTEGKISGTLSIPIFDNNTKKWKIWRKKKRNSSILLSKFRAKSPSTRTALTHHFNWPK